MSQPGDDRTFASPTVTVRGVGVAPAQPDGVKVVLTVRHRSDAADQALEEAARKAQELEHLFQELGIGPDRWVTVGLGLSEWTEWDEGSRRELHRGYDASSRVAVTLSDAGPLGRLLAEAAARVEAAVEGPWWEIDPENPAHEEARRRAMADGRRRASAYSNAAGLALGPIVEVVEAGPEHPRKSMRLPLGAAGQAFTAAAEMPLHPEGLYVTARVDVTFLLSSS